MNQIRICDKCKSINIKTFLPQLKKLYPKDDIIIACQNMCGIGRNKPFVIYNDKPIIGDNESDLINKINQVTNK